MSLEGGGKALGMAEEGSVEIPGGCLMLRSVVRGGVKVGRFTMSERGVSTQLTSNFGFEDLKIIASLNFKFPPVIFHQPSF